MNIDIWRSQEGFGCSIDGVVVANSPVTAQKIHEIVSSAVNDKLKDLLHAELTRVSDLVVHHQATLDDAESKLDACYELSAKLENEIAELERMTNVEG